MKRSTPPVVALTALNAEHQAIREHLADLLMSQHESGTVFYEGRLHSSQQPVVLAVTGPGNQAAAILVERARTTYRPRALLFVGVAGSLKDDIGIGDVVVATRVYAYHGGLEDDQGRATRPHSWQASHELEQLARHLVLTREWVKWLPAAARDNPPAVHFRPIAAGEVVLDASDSPLHRRLKRNFNDASAIEMESSGVALAGHLGSLPVLTIRGISDRADGGKNRADSAGSQATASAHAAALAAALIDALSTPPADADQPDTGQPDADQPDAGGRVHRFESYIQLKTAGFVGRDFAFDQFRAFREAHPCGHFLVEGLPGVGKTSLLAEATRRWDATAHFNIAAAGIDSQAAFLDSLYSQLSARYPLRLRPPEPNDEGDGRYLTRLLDQTADRLAPGEKLTIVVDALDEVRSTRPGVNPLYLPTTLPAGVFLLLSRRSHTAEVQIDGDSDLCDLMAHRAESRQDAEMFIQAFLARPELQARLGETADLGPIVVNLLEHSEFNFMYLMYVMRDIESGRMPLGDLHQPPRGLRGYYERHWQRMLSGGVRAEPSLRTIYTLARLRRPVTASLLASVTGASPIEVLGRLEDWAQFLEIARAEGSVTYCFYHKDFCDFLMEKQTVQAAGIDLAEISSSIGRGLISGLGFELDG